MTPEDERDRGPEPRVPSTPSRGADPFGADANHLRDAEAVAPEKQQDASMAPTVRHISAASDDIRGLSTPSKEEPGERRSLAVIGVARLFGVDLLPDHGDRARTIGEATGLLARIPNLRKETWKTLGSDQRLEALQALADHLADSQGRIQDPVYKWPLPHTPLSIKEANINWRACVTDKGAICLQDDMLDSYVADINDTPHLAADPTYAMEALAHEAYHRFGDHLKTELLSARRDNRSADLRGVSEATVIDLINAGTIPNGRIDRNGYLNHPEERLCRAYSRLFIRSVT